MHSTFTYIFFCLCAVIVSLRAGVIMVSQLVVELIQLVVSREMPPRRRGRATRQISTESEGQNEEIQRSVPGLLLAEPLGSLAIYGAGESEPEQVGGGV
ncbi:hypothetical protein F511_43130 [Dorcoceras hygrometricum]|uniref:Uncharacterized protein n=1 Tax=Dorcoceras hygrometricum TaxID=472368 RepID=A0A2Z7A9G2_9LAMI|nr:hypothetical protein F511_43130 [Dorcoceras hygrometricum]